MSHVVQKSTSENKSRGRPPEFDRDDVIEAGLGVFWAKGVEHTTLSDLEEATGTVRTTLYNSFDGKAGLHRAAIERYLDEMEHYLVRPLFEGSAGTEDIVEFLDILGSELTSDERPAGCLVVNDLTSPRRDVAGSNRYLELLENGIGAALRRAGDLDEIDPARIEPLTISLVAAIVGINVAARHSGAPAAERLIDGVREMVRVEA